MRALDTPPPRLRHGPCEGTTERPHTVMRHQCKHMPSGHQPDAPLTPYPGDDFVPSGGYWSHDPSPNAGAGWRGRWPLNSGHWPTAGTHVVYVLMDDQARPLYVGSTSAFRKRLVRHAHTKTWTRWAAFPYASRVAAYRAELTLITVLQPPLNAGDHSLRALAGAR